MEILIFAVCLLASMIGAICGIGGGVIIKPLLDSFHIMDVATISFLSGATVLSMSAYSVLRNKIQGQSHVEGKTGLPLAIGGALGGLVGKWLFSLVSAGVPNKDLVGAIQAICLLIVTLGTLVYTLRKDKIKTLTIENLPVCLGVGISLGIMSSFLGIGGGPMNLVVLYFFFSMETKAAVENSLYIIFFSQITSLAATLITGRVPAFEWTILAIMVTGGILGGVFGRGCNSKIKSATVEKLFIGLMIVIAGINVYNIYMFTR